MKDTYTKTTRKENTDLFYPVIKHTDGRRERIPIALSIAKAARQAARMEIYARQITRRPKTQESF